MRARMMRVGVVAAVVLIAAACSGSGDELVLDESLLDTSSTTTSTTALSSTTSTSEAEATTSLSELQAAEAEVVSVVEEWFVAPFDTSLGEEGVALEYTAGLVRQRTIELIAGYEESGQILRSRGGSRVEVRGIDLDLEKGQAEVEACANADYETVDAETGKVLASDDRDDFWISDYYVQLIDGEWKIVEWVPSQISENPRQCDIEGE